jgi:hypothetical protein
MFTLCIPTMDRYDEFLKLYLPKYLENNLIDEIIISDENGNDANKIRNNFPNNQKIIININKFKLGPFLNKMTCCKLAKNEWIVLIDSDNFADLNYFNIAKKFLESNTNINKNYILAPSWAKPNFNYTNLSGVCLNKKNIKQYSNNVNGYADLTTLMNTGNYIINKYLISNINLNNDIELIQNSSACDVILFNTLLFEQLDLHIYVVPNLFYNHVVHKGSVYTSTVSQTRKYVNIVHNKYFKLF